MDRGSAVADWDADDSDGLESTGASELGIAGYALENL